jgi:hypothetical protein
MLYGIIEIHSTLNTGSDQARETFQFEAEPLLDPDTNRFRGSEILWSVIKAGLMATKRSESLVNQLLCSIKSRSSVGDIVNAMYEFGNFTFVDYNGSRHEWTITINPVNSSSASQHGTGPMTDAEELFVISSISRKSIAEELNGYLEDIGVAERLSPDDARLTDARCKMYAEKLSDIDNSDPAEVIDKKVTMMNHSILMDMGLLPVEKSEELEEATVTVAVTLKLTRREGSTKTFDRQQAEMHAGQCVEMALRDGLVQRLMIHSAPFRASIEGVTSEFIEGQSSLS